MTTTARLLLYSSVIAILTAGSTALAVRTPRQINGRPSRLWWYWIDQAAWLDESWI